MPKTALLVIDVQEAIVHDPDYPMHEPSVLIQRINRLIAAFRQTGQPIVFIRHTEGEGSPLQEGLAGWQLDARLNVDPKDPRFNKTTPDSFLNTDLLTWLSRHGIQSVTVCGLQTDYCVDTTTRSAFSHGLKVVVVGDAHSTCDNGILSASDIIAHHNHVLGNGFASVQTTDDVLSSHH